MEEIDWLLMPLKSGGILVGSIILGFLLAVVLFRMVKWYAKKRDLKLIHSLHQYLRRPAFFLIPVLAGLLGLKFAEFSEPVISGLSLLLEILMYITLAWLLIQFTDVVGEGVKQQYNIDSFNNISERKIVTQLAFIKRLVATVVGFLAVAIILMQFETVREIGTGFLASAGIAGIIIGFAAQKSIANLLAGFQLAFTQPIRIDDVVIVEGEYGRVEEITLTYVVVRIWDKRRLVLPLNYFIEKPFQNWTRNSSDLLGAVFLHTDYRMPVSAIREELNRIVQGHELWDGLVAKVVVTNADRSTLEVRALVSGREASQLWDLRCEVREKLIEFIQREYPHCLPRTRVELPEQQLSGLSGDRQSQVEPGNY